MYFLIFINACVAQWQAQDGAQALAEAAGVSVLAGASATAVELESAPAEGAAAEPPLLKSVAYQPEPLSWKPGADNCLENDGLPHCGQSVNAGSEIFCKWSFAKPQDPHL
jgi:hypothetical protein